jgi:hypothetical protein
MDQPPPSEPLTVAAIVAAVVTGKIPTPLRPKSGLTTAWIVVLLAAIFFGGMFAEPGWNLVVILGALVLVLLVLGHAVVQRPLGVLIDEQNIMSLSRFQMAVWTVVVLASYFAYALMRMRAAGFVAVVLKSSADPLNVTIDPHLLALMGISATSFVASPYILGTKRNQEPDPTAVAKTALASGETPDEVELNRQGTLYANTSLNDARVTDMFQGDEVGNTMHLDMAKVQMFFFTVLAALAYLLLVFRNLRTSGQDLSSLPTLSDGVVYAVGISHGGYLASKGLDHTPTQ